MAKMFSIVWAVVGLLVLLFYLFRGENRNYLIILVALGIGVLIPILKELMRRRKEGFFVKTSGNADGSDLIYQEGGEKLIFYFDRPSRTIYIPSDRKWNESVPLWAKQRRGEISIRIQKRMGNEWRFEDKPD